MCYTDVQEDIMPKDTLRLDPRILAGTRGLNPRLLTQFRKPATPRTGRDPKVSMQKQAEALTKRQHRAERLRKAGIPAVED